MHRLAQIEIINFRSCCRAHLILGDYTPIVGYNNAGKSNILTAIEWFVDPSAISTEDFNDPNKPIHVIGTIEGISPELLQVMPPNQCAAITPYLVGDSLRLRRSMLAPGPISSAKLEIRNIAITDDDAVEAWKASPVGIPPALKTLFPEVIRIRAMQNVADDIGKSAKTNTIGKLIAEIIDPILLTHEVHLSEALGQIASRLSVDGDQRAAELNSFDEGATVHLSDLFPGLEIKVDLPIPVLADLFKGGTIKVRELHDDADRLRGFDSVGHGAQRCIQMALIRYLAERKAASRKHRRTLLLIDEPELYLHPQGIEQVRLALKRLASATYQVAFTTHSPLMLHREEASHTVMVRKASPKSGTVTRKPLATAVKEAIADAPHQSRVLFELGKAADVFFSDRVLLCEGKTEHRLIPLIYEAISGRTMASDRIGILDVGGCPNIAGSLRVLESMEIDCCAVADLDFAFVQSATGGLVDRNADPEILAAKEVLRRLQESHHIHLGSNGLPVNDKVTGRSAADAWALFATDTAGSIIVDVQLHKLHARRIWVWPQGAIEDVLGVREKGEAAIQDLGLEIASMSALEASARFPAVTAFLDWLRT